MSPDDQPIAITLTVRQWREINADLELRRLGDPWLALKDQLDEYDLAGDDCPYDGCTCTGPGCRNDLAYGTEL